ncbi:hypothetical protein JAO73_09185 [Hymenobacter sp. BT523]|uniref:hypothetical protein n=1 Tax=Hymenobacter sp. BT523 TaxID=2795725 RepID=UPI0018EB6F87|nr:hypothetical protein [Hymenobacter sp. BT523]MBJ6109183.1 hypothetical protein [Hymenobacter sp. BT523]
MLRIWGAVVGAAAAVGLGLAGCSHTAPPGSALARWAPDSATVTLAAGPQYARGPVWRFFWGAHYRSLWATPVTVPVIRLARAELDSLTPMRAGGSYQSRTLRLRTAAGHQLVLRSVDKDMSRALPAGWMRNWLSGLMRDQTSVSQPYGAYVAAPLAQAAGVYHANPRLVYLANDPALGKFQPGYANALYLLEERAEGDQEHQASFGGSRAIFNSHRMLAALRQSPSYQPDARAYLRARLLDMWLGDWSRREDQWRWASFLEGGGVVFRPIPRDRDQAFFRFDDGVLTRLLSWFLPKFQSFHATIKPGSVEGLTRTARALDRTLLSTLSAEDFRQEADSLQRRLTDAAIAQALTAGPKETQATIAEQLGPALQARRAQLPAVARRYFELLAEEAWVPGTDRAERFRLTSAGPGQLRLRVLAIRPARPDSLISERVYAQHDTKKLSLYGLAGNDVFTIDAAAAPGIAVALYPGEGQDRVVLPAAAKAEAAKPLILWYGRPGSPAPALPGLTVEQDPEPGLSATAAGWLRRYNLQD